MSKRDKIIDSFKYDEDKNLAAKIIDFIEQVQKYYEPRYTVFLDPSQVMKGVGVIEQFHDIKHLVTCGVQGLERNIIAIYPDSMDEEELNLPVTALCISGQSKFEKINHRDILGALMNLGIKREKIGDIIINDDKCYIIVYNDISYYIIINLSKIKHTSVKIDYVEFDHVSQKQDKFKEIVSNTASLRLDAILSCGFGESRSSIVGEIMKGNVKVNFTEVKENSYIINEGDIISLRGHGRIVLDKVIGITKKGRINILIKKII